MDTKSQIPPRLEPVLRRIRSRIRRVLFTRGALITAVTALVGLMLIAALDFFFSPLPAAIRWLLPLLWLAVVLTVVVTAWFTPLRRPLNLVRIARWLETRHPDIDERISTVLEVSKPGHAGMSSGLISEIAREAADSIDRIDPLVEVTNRRAKRWLWPALALIALWGAAFALWPDSTSRHLVRALVPNSNLGTSAGTLTVTPGSLEIIAGDPLEITANHSDGPATPLELILHLPDGSSTAMPMEQAENGSLHHFGRAEQSFEYQVRHQRETSDRFQVTVWPEPLLTDPRVRLEFPAYTGWAPREQALADGLSAITGTRVTVRSKLNTPVEQIRLEIDGETAGKTTHQTAADGGSVSSLITLGTPGNRFARLIASHRLDREFDLAAFTIESLPDAPPEARWLSVIQKELRLRRDDLLEFAYEITDDVGLGIAELEVQPESGDPGRLPLNTPQKLTRSETPAWRGRLHQSVGQLASKFPGSNVFKIRVRAEDSRPAELQGPGVGTTEWLTIRIDDGAQSLARQQLFAAHSDTRDTIEKARQLARQAREKIDRHRNDIREAKQEEWIKKDLTEAREQLAEASESLKELAERMPESVHADKTKPVEKAAETLEQARQELENSALQDTPEQRDQTAQKSRDLAHDAERQLDALRNETRKDENQINDLAKLKELEQQQRELARQAEEALAENTEDPETRKQWQQKQDQLAEQLRQNAQQRPEAKTASLEQQAEQAKQLAEQAREQSADQQAMRELAENEPSADPLREQLAEEQSQIAEEAATQLAEARERQDHQTANSLPEAVESAESAAEALTENNDPASATQEAEEAATQLEQAAETAASEAAESSTPAEQAASAEAAAELAKLAERQQDVAEALDALEQGDLAEAAADLAGMHAEETADLAENIKEAPEVNGWSEPMGQAAQAAEQASKQAEQAAKSESQGKAQDAAGQHQQASEQLAKAADKLDQAADQFAQQAAKSTGKPTPAHQAPAPGEPLAEAFQQASKAADANNKPASASHARAAAQALARASHQTMAAMQGQAPPKPGQPGPPKPGPAGQLASDDPRRLPEGDQGLPPELAKLGITLSDWEKIKASLNSEVGGSSAIALPEEYRGLVRSYFEAMSKTNN